MATTPKPPTRDVKNQPAIDALGKLRVVASESERAPDEKKDEWVTTIDNLVDELVEEQARRDKLYRSGFLFGFAAMGVIAVIAAMALGWGALEVFLELRDAWRRI